MPWTSKDARSHTKAAKTPTEKKAWSRVANRVLSESGDEGKAVRIANAVIKRAPRG